MAESVKTLSTTGDYTSAQLWWDTECKETDCVATTTSPVLQCHDDWPSGLNESFMDFDAGTAYAANDTYHPIMRPADGHGCTGIPETGFHFAASASYGIILTLTADYIEISGIGFKNTSTGQSAKGLGVGANNTADGCIARTNSQTASYGFYNFHSTTKVRNCIALDAGKGFYTTAWENSTLENCLAANCGTGFYRESNGTTTLKNCATYGCTTPYELETTTSYWDTTNSTNNASNDYAGSPPPGVNPYTSDVVSGDFVDAANDDFHLSASSGLIGQGANLYSDFTTDIDCETRPSSGAWDIGPDHFVGSGTTPITQDADLRWSILQALTSDSDLRWDLLNALTSDSDLRWSLIQAIEQSADFRWSLIEAITQDADLRWSMLQALSSDSELRWDVLNALTSDSNLRWDLISGIEQSIDLRWDLLSSLSPVASDITLQWSMLSRIDQALDARWDVLNAIGVSADLRWSIVEAIGQSLTAQWDVLSALSSVSSDLTLTWDAIALVDGAVELRWTIDGEAAADVPPIRIIVIPEEGRVFAIGAEDRVFKM